MFVKEHSHAKKILLQTLAAGSSLKAALTGMLLYVFTLWLFLLLQSSFVFLRFDARCRGKRFNSASFTYESL